MKSLRSYITEKLVIIPSQVNEKLVIFPSQVNEKLVIFPSQVNEKLVINKNFVQVGNPDDDIIDDIIDRNLWDNKDEMISRIMKFGCPMSMFKTAWEIFCNETNVYGVAPDRNVINDIRNKIKSMYNSDSKYPILNFLRSEHVNDMLDDFEKANIHTKVLVRETPKYDIRIEWISTEKYDMLFFGKLTRRYHIFLHRKK